MFLPCSFYRKGGLATSNVERYFLLSAIYCVSCRTKRVGSLFRAIRFRSSSASKIKAAGWYTVVMLRLPFVGALPPSRPHGLTLEAICVLCSISSGWTGSRRFRFICFDYFGGLFVCVIIGFPSNGSQWLCVSGLWSAASSTRPQKYPGGSDFLHVRISGWL